MRFEVITLFPEIFTSYLGQSLLKKAVDRDLVEVRCHDIRDWSRDKHRKVDDRPYGGGPGMVLRVEPIVECVEAVTAEADLRPRTVLLTPQGTRLTQRRVEDLATVDRLILICGRYEGIDQRVVDILKPEEISVGDYVLNGGETAAMVIIDSVIRLIPGVLGDAESSVQDSFSSGNRLLESPQYTRPLEYRGLSVPDVLLSGNHAEVERWRREQGYLQTRRRRSDLLPGGRAGEPKTDQPKTDQPKTSEPE